jgi:hypothetical protein
MCYVCDPNVDPYVTVFVKSDNAIKMQKQAQDYGMPLKWCDNAGHEDCKVFRDGPPGADMSKLDEYMKDMMAFMYEECMYQEPGKGLDQALSQCEDSQQECPYTFYNATTGEPDYDKVEIKCAPMDQSCPCNVNFEKKCPGEDWCSPKDYPCPCDYDTQIECYDVEYDSSGEPGDYSQSCIDKTANASTACKCDKGGAKTYACLQGTEYDKYYLCLPESVTACKVEFCEDTTPKRCEAPVYKDGEIDWDKDWTVTCVADKACCPCDSTNEIVCTGADFAAKEGLETCKDNNYCLPKVWSNAGACPTYCKSNEQTCYYYKYNASGNIVEEKDEFSGEMFPTYTEECKPGDAPCPCHEHE